MNKINNNNVLLLFPKIIILLSILVFLTNYISYYTNFLFYEYTIQEDGWIENCTAFLLGLSGSTLLLYLLKYHNLYTRIGIAITFLTAVGLLFGFGEELSWGQRIFNINSTPYFSENNLQQETNIHNLKIKGIELNTIIFTYGLGIVFAIYFCLLRPLYLKKDIFRKLIDQYYIPIPRIWHLILFFSGTILILIMNHDKKWELWELLFALTIYAIVCYSHNNVYKKVEP